MADAYLLQGSTFPSATGVIDNFNRTEDPLSDGGLWSSPVGSGNNTLRATGTEAARTAAGGVTGDAYRNNATQEDSEVWVTLSVLDAVNAVGVFARIRDAGLDTLDAYLLTLTTADDWFLVRFVDGVQTVLDTFVQAVAAGDGLGFRVTTHSGNVILRAYRRSGGVWSELRTFTDTTPHIFAGNLGLLCDETTWRMDDFGGGIETATDRFLLEDGTGVYLLEQQAAVGGLDGFTSMGLMGVGH